ncbi:MAG: L,D-transpeptidase/peptidoglycan binding protein [Roseburia sp.]|nr:L,D-transpeptidase/peptidoglycan binding protein [Roseburia sp.]
MAQKRKKRRRKKSVLQKSLHLALGTVVFIFLAVYIFFCFYFHSHFFYQTRMEDMDVSGMTAEEAAANLKSEVRDYLLTIYDRDGNKYQILGMDFEYEYQPSGEEEKLVKDQPFLLWPGKITKQKNLDIDKSITYDTELLKKEVNALDCFDTEHMKEPVNAHIGQTENGYELIPEEQGSYLLADKVYTHVKAAVEAGETELTLPDEVYQAPEVTSEDEILSTCMKEIESYFGASVTYDMGTEKEVVDRSVISDWINVSADYQVTFDESAAASFVQRLASKYNTYGDVRQFKTSRGDTVSIGGGDYGWVVDKEKELAQLLEEVKNGEVVTREPMYQQRAAKSGLDDIGDTYLEIDYTNQHLYYYEEGSLRMDTDIVSGNISRGNGSPDGVFKIVYKKSPAVLKGEDYESNVTYFMPFAYNVGVHDASWRNGRFGGEIYRTSGSHGCINVPEEAATKLYEMIEVDTPVVAYYREEVRLTAENTKISNAFSYYDEEKEKKKEEQQTVPRTQDNAVAGENQIIEEDGNVVTVPEN